MPKGFSYMIKDENTNYKCVYVRKDSSVREISILEKIYLQTKYSGSDGDRPYIKTSYYEKNVLGDISGFCYRSNIPIDKIIEPYNPSISKNEIEEEIKRIKKMGYEIEMKGIVF
jgi:hypothetical protein